MWIGIGIKIVNWWRSLLSGPFGGHPSLTDDLVSVWPLSTDGFDVHGTNDLTNNNGVTFVAKGAGAPANMPDTVANFASASAQSLTIADNASLSLGSDSAFTWVAWVKPPATGVTVTSAIVHKWAVGDPQHIEYGLTLLPGANDYLLSTVGNGTLFGGVDTSASSIFSDGVWALVIFWHDPAGDEVSIQVNNGTVFSSPWTGGTFDGSGTFAIGRAGNFGVFFSELAQSSTMFWKNRILTAGERTALWNSGAGLFY